MYVDEFEKYPLEYEFETPDANNLRSSRQLASFRSLLTPYWGGNDADFRCPSERRSPGYYPYLYNTVGTGSGPDTLYAPPFDWGRYVTNDLGLGVLGAANVPVPESRVRVPSDMIAIGELAFFGFPYGHTEDIWRDMQRRLHGRLGNAVFCDGHVDSSDPGLLPHQPGGYFIPDAARAKRFNNDNQPHPETWPKP